MRNGPDYRSGFNGGSPIGKNPTDYFRGASDRSLQDQRIEQGRQRQRDMVNQVKASRSSASPTPFLPDRPAEQTSGSKTGKIWLVALVAIFVIGEVLAWPWLTKLGVTEFVYDLLAQQTSIPPDQLLGATGLVDMGLLLVVSLFLAIRQSGLFLLIVIGLAVLRFTHSG